MNELLVAALAALVTSTIMTICMIAYSEGLSVFAVVRILLR